jgi:hypothetical protein
MAAGENNQKWISREEKCQCSTLLHLAKCKPNSSHSISLFTTVPLWKVVVSFYPKPVCLKINYSAVLLMIKCRALSKIVNNQNWGIKSRDLPSKHIIARRFLNPKTNYKKSALPVFTNLQWP